MAQDSGDGAKRSAEIKRTKTENVPGRKEVLWKLIEFLTKKTSQISPEELIEIQNLLIQSSSLMADEIDNILIKYPIYESKREVTIRSRVYFQINYNTILEEAKNAVAKKIELPNKNIKFPNIERLEALKATNNK